MEDSDLLNITMSIAHSGNAKSLGFEAVQLAQDGKFEESELKYKEAKDAFAEVHEIHLKFLQQEAKGNKVEISMLFLHMEDHIMTTSLFLDMAKLNISMLKRLHLLENK